MNLGSLIGVDDLLAVARGRGGRASERRKRQCGVVSCLELNQQLGLKS